MIVVFWLDSALSDKDESRSKKFETNEMLKALEYMNGLRATPFITHVTMCSEMPGSVGKPGVDSVVDGKTPDGQPYTWSKADRAGKMKKIDYLAATPEDAKDY